jgi:Fe-S-cluster containining protein
VEDFRDRHLRRSRGFYSLKELPNGDCEFLRRDPDGKRRCGVYEARPLQCRTWPFWSSNVSSRAAWDSAARGCPGMNSGEHHPLPIVQDALQRNAAARLPL